MANYWLSGLGGLGMDLFSGRNGVVLIRICKVVIMKIVGIYLGFAPKRRMSSFEPLELEIWTEH